METMGVIEVTRQKPELYLSESHQYKNIDDIIYSMYVVLAHSLS